MILINQGKLLDYVIQTENKENILEAIDCQWVEIETYSVVIRLNVWEKELWYLVLGRNDKAFTENEEKIIHPITTSISWVINRNKSIEEEKNKDFILQEKNI